MAVQQDEDYFGSYGVLGVTTLVSNLIELQGIAQRNGLDALFAGVANILLGLLRDLNAVSQQFARVADEQIELRIEATRAPNRPPWGEMATHIISEPGPPGTGSVGVAKLDELDKIRNPSGYGPFWIAQEFGTGVVMDYGPYAGNEIPEQAGRRIFGTFYESEEPPEAAQQGLGVGTDMYFLPMGSAPGLGRISVELPGRHFLRDGITEAGREYVAAINAIQQKWMNELNKLQAALIERPTTYVGIIEA